MNTFTVTLESALQCEQLDGVSGFVGEDASGSFGLMAGHTRFVTTLVFGLARLHYLDGRVDYLAFPGAVAYFAENQLTLTSRRYLRGEDYLQISDQLREELVQEERALAEIKHSLVEMERSMLLRLWRMARGEDLTI